MAEHRNLAFYKQSGKPWTADEFNQIIDYCEEGTTGVDPEDISNVASKYKYIFDGVAGEGTGTAFMDLCSSKDSEAFKHCTKICFETFFNQPELKVYSIEDYIT